MSYFDNSGRGGFLANMTPAVRNLLIINVIFFIASQIIGDPAYEKFALFSFGSPFFRPYQLVSHMFMHGGFWHIFFNMYSLVLFGTALENIWGSRKFLIFFFVTGIGAALCHNLVMHLQIMNDPANAALLMRIPTVGASGAIYGLLLGFAMLFPEAEFRLFIFPFFPLKAKWMAVIFCIIELLTGLNGGDNIAHFAHLGGMLFGLILILIWKKNNKMYNYN